MKIKVCGLTDMKQIQEVTAMGINFIGFIFYAKSPRFVLNHLHENELSAISHEGKVGVFVNEKIERIAEMSENCGLNFVQLHGEEDENFVVHLRQHLSSHIKIIKVLRIGETNNVRTIDLETSADYLLFDTDTSAFGGSGKTFDWKLLNALEIPKPYFLSGGISLENIHRSGLLRQKPFALDVNSRFESRPGIKDLQKIRTLKSLLQ